MDARPALDAGQLQELEKQWPAKLRLDARDVDARVRLEWHSIGRRLHVPQRTVARSLAELQQEWAERAAEDAGQLVSVTLARLELAYRDATEASQRSLAF